MSLTVSDPTTYTVPEGQALLFTAVENEETVYKYKLDTGSIGKTTLSIVKALDVKPADLPCLVYKADLLNCMNENFVSVGEMAIAIATKASVKYVKQIADQKVSKATFLSTVAEMPTTSEMNAALALKANASDVTISLSSKANSSDVYTQAETVALLESFIGAQTVTDITALNALEPGIYRFVWVLDPSDDASVVDKTAPALYRWREAQGETPAGYEFLQSATSGAFAGTIQEILDILGTGFDSDHTVSAAINAKASASDLSSHTGNSNIHVTSEDKTAWSGKQNAITGTSGQFVKINAQGVPEAVTVDMTSFGSVRSVNSISPDSNGDISLTIPADLGDLTDSEGTITALQEKAHAHVLDVANQPSANYSFIHKFYGCNDRSAYASLTEMSIAGEGVSMDTFAQSESLTVKAFTTGYAVIGDGSLLFSSASAFNGTFTDITGELSGITDAAISGASVVAALVGTSLYVKAAPPATSLTSLPSSGNLRGSTVTLSKTEWAAVSGSYTAIESHGDHWLAIGVNGELYTAGSNKFHMQNIENIDIFVNTLTAVTISGLASGETIVQAGAGRNFSLAMSEYSNGTKHKIYAWGRQINGELGDGVSYLHDSDKLTYRSFQNGGDEVFVIMEAKTGNNADPFTEGTKTLVAGTEVFSFANGHVEFVGVTDADATGLTTNGATIAVGGVTYSRVIADDKKGYALGSATPTAIKIPTLAYAYKSSDGTIVYTNTDTPAKTGKIYSDSALSSQINGSITAGGYGYLVHGGITYNRSYYDDVVTSETVCDDWIKMSAGYYHAGALRKNANNETEVYLWGSNEYGQLGTGYYKLDSLTTSSLSGQIAASVEIINRPMKLPSSLFPYTDVVDIQCTHYGTFLTRSNGKIYFAGCNKRNYLGTGILSEETAFIPKFIALSTSFINNKVYAETYGSIIVHDTPVLKAGADDVVKTVFKELTTEKLDDAISATHNHAVDPGLIDSVAIGAAQYVDSLPLVLANTHAHSNQSSLDAISVRNNNLYINGVIYQSGGGGGGGTGVVVDESNIQLDKLSDVTGLTNLAGGFGLEVISYRRLNDSDDNAGAIIQVAPVGSVTNPFGRYVSLYNSAKTAIDQFSAANQAKGLWGVPYGGTAGFINSTKDLVTMIEAVIKKGASNNTGLKLYYVEPSKIGAAGSAQFSTSGASIFADISYATLVGYGTLYWQMELGSTVQPNSEYMTTDKLVGVGLGTYDEEEEAFFDVYKSGQTSTPVIEKDDFGDATSGYGFFFDDGNPVTSAASMVIPYTTDAENHLVYHAIYDNDEQTGTPILTSEDIASGLRMKVGTSFVKIEQYMVPEKFNEDLFKGSIFIHTSKSNFCGMANNYYEFDTAANGGVAFSYGTTAVDGVYPLEKVVIKLKKALAADDESTSSFTPTPGSIEDPIYAAVYSGNRYYTSSVSGENNASVGYNSEAGGNQNTVVGNWSEAKGLVNVVAGNMSFAQGAYNVVVAANSNAYGYGNLVAGTQNIAIGAGNMTHGYYGVTIGDGNQIFGLNDIAVGSRNTVYTTMGGAIAVGDQNIVQEKAKDAVVIGKELDVAAEAATVVGQKGKLERFDGVFPGENSDTLVSIQAASVNAWKNLGYDEVWKSNKEGLFFGAGLKKNRTLTTVFPLAFTKYRVRPNIANYFEKATTTTARGSNDPYIFEPFMQWTFTGIIHMNFTDPQASVSDVTDFTFASRDGGRLKSFDPGIVEAADGANTVSPEFDFDKATRWKLAADGVFKPLPFNFVDGAEAYVVIYHGASVDWTGFTNNTSAGVEGANNFDSVSSESLSAIPSAVGKASGFVLVKLMVVDNVCVAEVVANTLKNS